MLPVRKLAGMLGFEPKIQESKSCVLSNYTTNQSSTEREIRTLKILILNQARLPFRHFCSFGSSTIERTQRKATILQIAPTLHRRRTSFC